MVAKSGLAPVAPRTVPLASTAQVMDDLLNRRVVGKVALLP
jgi:NADPH2:quinone reductase